DLGHGAARRDGGRVGGGARPRARQVARRRRRRRRARDPPHRGPSALRPPARGRARRPAFHVHHAVRRSGSHQHGAGPCTRRDASGREGVRRGPHRRREPRHAPVRAAGRKEGIVTVPDRTQVPAPGAIRPFAFPHLERRRLANGLTVIAARAGDLPLVTAALVVDAGAAADPAQKAGLANLTALALETGTRARSAEEVAWAFESLGVEFEAEATWDAAAFRVTVPAGRIEPALELFAEVVRSPVFPEHEVARLRDEQLAHILQRRKEPRALASDMAARFIFAPDVPYARPLVGTTASVEGLTREDVEAFYNTHYVPNASSLILVGAIDIDEAERLARLYFGDWPRAAAPATEFEVKRAV